MRQFFKFTIASMFGSILLWFLSFILLLLMIFLISKNTDNEITLADKTVLKIDLSIKITDKKNNPGFDDLSFLSLTPEISVDLLGILKNIEKAKLDSKISGIVLTGGYASQGSAQLSEIRAKLLEFKESGKFIYSYSDIYTQNSYWLSTVSDSIFLNPIGEIEFKGIAAEITFFKNFQDKFGVKFDIIRHGKYKSAVEPFIDDKMSEENRLQTYQLINSIWSTYLNDISLSRNIDIEKLNHIADNRFGDDAENAKALGLVDVIAYEDQFEDFLKEKLGLKSYQDINSIGVKKYSKVINPSDKPYTRQTIAILYAEGEITYMSGEGSETVVHDNFISAIRQIKDDDDIKGVVLRVNSPGGSALASDLIWRELELLKREKPVVASFGNVAASGGYYIACGAHSIYADPSSITGSIGVFGMIPNLEKAANNIGINSEVVSTNKMSFDYSLTKGANQNTKNHLQKGVEKTYQNFVDRVAKGRNLSFERIDEIAQGRVWGAADAKLIGLIDSIGGIEQAIKACSQLAGIENYRLESYPEEEDELQKFIDSWSDDAKMKLIEKELGSGLYQLYNKNKIKLNDKGIQAMMPFEIQLQ